MRRTFKVGDEVIYESEGDNCDGVVFEITDVGIAEGWAGGGFVKGIIGADSVCFENIRHTKITANKLSRKLYPKKVERDGYLYDK